MINVISLGGGKQSTYMMLNALDGKYKYMPDFAIFADTGCEPKYVYEHLEMTKKHVKDKYNFDIVVVSNGDLKKDVEDYTEGKTKRASQLPFFTENGIVMRQCTADYKIKPIRQHLQKVRSGERVRMWIGISLDEIERMKDSNVKYIENYYPLVEERISIDTIVKWYSDNGYDEPMKSACLICPFHSLNYWKRFKKVFPDEFKEACDFDDKIRNYPKMNSKLYVSRLRKPLKDSNFNYNNSLFPELIEDCEGLCGL